MTKATRGILGTVGGCPDKVEPIRSLDLPEIGIDTSVVASVTFDSLKFTKRLTESGMTSDQAEAIASAFAEATGSELVTKDHLRAEFESAKNDLIKWMAGLLLAQAGLVTALVKLL